MVKDVSVLLVTVTSKAGTCTTPDLSLWDDDVGVVVVSTGSPLFETEVGVVVFGAGGVTDETGADGVVFCVDVTVVATCGGVALISGAGAEMTSMSSWA